MLGPDLKTLIELFEDCGSTALAMFNCGWGVLQSTWCNPSSLIRHWPPPSVIKLVLVPVESSPSWARLHCDYVMHGRSTRLNVQLWLWQENRRLPWAELKPRGAHSLQLLFIESVMLICLVWSWNAAVLSCCLLVEVTWDPGRRLLMLQCGETVDKRLCNVSTGACVAVGWNSLYALCFSFLLSSVCAVSKSRVGPAASSWHEYETCYWKTVS